MPFTPKRLHGLSFFILAMLLFSCMNITIHHMSGQMHPIQMVFIRNVFSFMFLLPFALRKGISHMKTGRLPRHLLRAFVGLVAMQSWFYSLAHLPVNMATALSFSTPLFSTLLAVLFLGERIRWMRITALLAGFAGVLVILNPTSTDNLHPVTWIVLFSAFMMAVAGIQVKMLTATEPSWRIVFYMAGFMTLMSLPLALMVWKEPVIEDITPLLLIALFSTTAQICMAEALRTEKMVVLMPFEFTRLIFTAILAWLIFAEPITPYTIIGSLMIIASTAFISWREYVIKRQTITLENA